MGLSPQVALRAVRRIGLSSAGEAVGRAVNLVIPFVVLAAAVADRRTDLFFLVLAVAYFVQGTLASALANTLVVEFVADRQRRSAANLVPWSVIAAVVAGSVAGLLAAPVWTSGQVSAVAISVAVAAAAGLLAAPAVAAINAEHRYVMPGLTWAFRVVPVALYWAAGSGTDSLPWLVAGIAAADLARAAVLLRLTRRRLTLGRDASPLGFPTDALHLVASGMVAGVTPFAARLIASTGEPGAVSVYETAERIYGALASLATIGLGNVILVYLARTGSTDERALAWRWIVRSAVTWSLLWALVAGAVWLGFPRLAHLLSPQSGETLGLIRDTFLVLSFGFPAFVMGLVLSRRILIQGQASSLVRMAGAGLVVSVFGGWMLLRPLGPAGIAASVVAGQYLVFAMMASKVREPERNAHPGTG